MYKTLKLVATVLFATSFLIACKPRLIPGSSVSDTKENRAVAAFMEKYKKAIEAHSVPELMELVAPDFYESNGTPEMQDDYGYSQLEQKLGVAFTHLKTVAIRFHIQKIEHKNDVVEVFYYFNEHALAEFPVGEEWISSNDVNRLVLRPNGKKAADGYKIVSGL